MLCKKCGIHLRSNANFCQRCGSAVAKSGSENALEKQAEIKALKKLKSRKIIFSVRGALFAAVFLLLIFVLTAMFPAGNSGSGTEGPGFPTPEDAAKAYLLGLRNQDFEAMISSFAIESYAENFDLSAYVERLQAYTISMVIHLPNVNKFTSQLAAEERRSSITRYIVFQYMSHNSPGVLENGTAVFRSSEEIADFIEQLRDGAENSIFSDLRITGAMQPEDIQDLYASEINQRNIARMAESLGVQGDDIANPCIIFSAGGRDWIFCPQVIRYGGKWYMESFSGNFSSLLGIDILKGGIVPFDAVM